MVFQEGRPGTRLVVDPLELSSKINLTFDILILKELLRDLLPR